MKKRITKISSIFLALMMVISLFNASYFVHAEDKVKVNVRVEGLTSTICEGDVEVNNGQSALDAVSLLLSEKNVESIVKESSYTYDGKTYTSKYIDEINGIKSKKFNSDDGWMYTVKKTSGFDTDTVSNNAISSYSVHVGDNIIVYYGSYSKTPCANTIKFDPAIPKANEAVKISFINTSFDWNANKNVEAPITNIMVAIDDRYYAIDNNGQITIKEGLSLGNHTYSISGYKENSFPYVVADKGIFQITGTSSPNMDYTGTSYSSIYYQDNTKLTKNIPQELQATGNTLNSLGGNEWYTVSEAKMGYKVDSSFLADYEKDIKENGAASYNNTDLEKLIISLAASGYSPYSFAGNDLIKELYNRDVNDFSINDGIFALIAYKYCNISDNGYKIKKSDLVNSIISKEYTYNKDLQLYGWAITKADTDTAPDPDMTGIAINALAPYYNEANVKSAVDKAVNSFSKMQNESGYLIGKNGITSESLSFAILGLTSIGKDPQGSDFTKIKGDLVTALLSFKGTNGWFKHILTGSNDNLATEEAFRALIAINNFDKNGKYDYYASNVDASKLTAIYSTDVGTTTKVDATKNTVINKEVFNDIKGQNKNVDIKYNGISWTFNGMDITSEVDSNIDLSLKDVSVALKNKEAAKIKALIGKNVPIFSFSFNYDGKLPGKATAKVFVGASWANKNVTLFRYYSDKNTYEKITTGQVDKDGYLTYTIDHCSDYFITETNYVEKLPQTGSPIDTKIIIVLGTLMLAAGAAFIYANKKKEERA